MIYNRHARELATRGAPELCTAYTVRAQCNREGGARQSFKVASAGARPQTQPRATERRDTNDSGTFRLRGRFFEPSEMTIERPHTKGITGELEEGRATFSRRVNAHRGEGGHKNWHYCTLYKVQYCTGKKTPGGAGTPARIPVYTAPVYP